MSDVQVLTQSEAMQQQALSRQHESQGLASRYELTVEEVVARVTKVKDVMKALMKEDVHYGKVPGTDKDTLFQPGAQLLNITFRLTPRFKTVEMWEENGHLTVKSICESVHIPTGQVWGTGEAMCSTKESKYAFRKGERICPKCGKAAIIKGKDEYGGGWVCFRKKDGCNAKFPDDDAAITSQQVGLVVNPNIADTYNTVTKMANKRSQNTSVLNATGASDVFTTDMEDVEANASVHRPDPVVPPRVDPETGEVRDQPQATEPRDNGGNGRAEGEGAPKISDAQRKFFWAIAHKHGWSEAEVKALLEKAGVDSVANIGKRDLDGIITELKKKVKG